MGINQLASYRKNPEAPDPLKMSFPGRPVCKGISKINFADPESCRILHP